MILIDTDNALGSPRGDVDDGFAVAAMLASHSASHLRVGAIASTFGNCSQEEAHRNNRRLGHLMAFEGPYLRGACQAIREPSPASRFLAGMTEPTRVLALGPLTTIAAALREHEALHQVIEEVVIVGGCTASRGFLYPVWPFEFNLVKDRHATRSVFASELSLTFVPLDVAKRLRAGRRELATLPGAIGQYLRDGSVRWLDRRRWRYGATTFPVWDLVAAMVSIDPTLFRVETTRAACSRSARVEFGAGDRLVRVVKDFDPTLVWERFRQSLTDSRP